MSNLDPRVHASAVKAAITATVGAGRVFDYGKVPGADGNPGTLPDIYVLTTVEPMGGALLNMAAKASRRGWRVTARGVGRSVAEAGWALAQVSEALDEVALVVGGAATSPAQLESGQDAEPDDGRYSGLSVWTYTL